MKEIPLTHIRVTSTRGVQLTKNLLLLWFNHGWRVFKLGEEWRQVAYTPWWAGIIPLLCRLRSSLRQKQHAVLFLMPNWNLRWGDGLVGLWRHMTPLWGFSRPSPGFVYKVFWRDPWTWSLMVDRLRLGFWAVTIWCFSPHRCRHQSRWWILECRSGRLLGRLRGNLISSKILCDNLTDVISKCDQSMGPGHLAHPLSLWRRGQLLLWRRWFLLWSIVM